MAGGHKIATTLLGLFSLNEWCNKEQGTNNDNVPSNKEYAEVYQIFSAYC